MSRKRIRKLLSAAMGVLALGGGVSSAAKVSGENESTIDKGESVTRTHTEEDVDNYEEENGEPDEMGPGIGEYEPGVEDEPDNFDEYDSAALKDLSARMENAKVRMSNINAKFMELSSKWTNELSDKGGAALKNNNTTISTSIKTISGIKENFDRANSDFTHMLASTPTSPLLYDVLDRTETFVRNMGISVDQLEINITNYERELQNEGVNKDKEDQQKRKVNASLISNERSGVSEYLKDVRKFMKNTKFTDIKNYKGRVDRLSVDLSDIRKRLDSKGDDGVSNDEYNSISNQLKEIKSKLQEIRIAVADAGRVYNKETDHGLLTKTLLQLNAMWRGFASECNPKKVSASGMSKDSAEQCQVFYNTVKNVYSEWKKTIRAKINIALKDMDKYSEEIDNLCQRALSEFNASIVASTRSFSNVQEFEARRARQISPSEYRQKARADFVNECRSIRDRDELTRSEMIDELVGAMNKILPGRESFHRQMLNILSRDVQIDNRGNVDATSLLSKNALLIGAPGNGKTEEARAAADALGLKIIYANGDDFATEASSNRFYNNLVNETLNANGRYAIFFDEIDSIFTNRALIKDAAGEQKGAVTVFNNFVTRMQNSPELMKKFAGMMGTTNLAPDALDTALTSRFPQQLHVPRFDESDARQFLRVELEPVSITANTTKEALIDTLATIMANKNMDARKALNLIDEVWNYAKSNMDAAPTPDMDAAPAAGELFDDDASSDVIIKPRDLVSAFNGMKIGDGEKKTSRTSRWDRDDIGGATTRPSTPEKY